MKYMVLLCFLNLNVLAEKADTPVVHIPGSDIFLFDIEQNAHGVLGLSVGTNITKRPGYDSQPKFSHDGALLYYTRAVDGDDGSQMDIYQYDIATAHTQAYMHTEYSEYSPTPLPHNSNLGPHLSVVQVDAAGDQYVVILDQAATQDQRMQRYTDLKQVGYFNWTQQNKLWSFVLNDKYGGDLYLQDGRKMAQKIASNVGRAFINDAKAEYLYYVDKNSTPWRIHKRKGVGEAVDVMPLPIGVEDFTLDSAGRFWAGRDNTLFVSTDQQRWFIITEFTNPKFHGISRVTTNPQADKIAIVFAEKPAI